MFFSRFYLDEMYFWSLQKKSACRKRHAVGIRLQDTEMLTLRYFMHTFYKALNLFK